MAGNSTVKKLLFFITLSTLAVFSFFFFAAKTTNAQSAASPQFLLTWKALRSYVPAGYKGKALPGLNSPIGASLEVISGGKVVSLSGKTINWYLDEGPIAGGIGVQHIIFNPDIDSAPGTMELRVEIPNYNGSFIIHAVDIPVVQPKAVIDGPYPQGQFSDSSLTLRALSYFTSYPASSLSYAWSVNGVDAQSAENPDVAQINIPSDAAPGSTINAALTVTNPADNTSAQATENFTYVKQL